MKRFLIFAVLVPPVALAVFLVPEAAAISTMGNIFMTLALLYPIGLIPAALTAVVDWSLSGRSNYLRMAVTVIFAIILAELIAQQGLGVPWSPRVWLIGAIPAALCSWLAGRQQA